MVALTILLSLIEIALWLGIARACRNGKSWARVTGTVLFGLHTLGFLGVLANSHPGLGLAKVLTTLSWLIACGAVVFLWQRPSSAFFQAAADSRPCGLRCGIPRVTSVLHNGCAQLVINRLAECAERHGPRDARDS